MDYNFEKELIQPSKGMGQVLIDKYKNMNFDNEDFQFEEIFPKVFVYKNMFPNTGDITQILKRSVEEPDLSVVFKDWVQWGGLDGGRKYGQYVAELFKGLENENLTAEEYKTAQKELFVVIKVIKNFFAVTDHYTKYWKLEGKENWIQRYPSFCRYIPLPERPQDNLFMNYHTDYEIEKASEPGEKFVITTTMYFNDDYKGGALLFKEGSKRIGYKPEAGDIVVFPSGHPSVLMEGENPIMHGVSPVLHGNPDRYIVRMFHVIYSDGDNVKEIIKENNLKNR